MDDGDLMRIGELSRRSGVSTGLLRMWERRYGILEPGRTAGGQRMYSGADERRVKAMRQRMDDGLSAAAAARITLAGENPLEGPGDALEDLRASLSGALRHFDEAGAHAALDVALARFSIPSALEMVVLPYLQELGAGWEAGNVSIAQEHFATMILRGRLLGLARNWGSGAGPTALLASPAGEFHDLGLICFGLGLRERGWRITLLGPNTPGSTMIQAVGAVRPRVVVVSSMDPALLESIESDLARVAATSRLLLAGPGATEPLARRTGAGLLSGAPMAAAYRLSPEDALPGIEPLE